MKSLSFLLLLSGILALTLHAAPPRTAKEIDPVLQAAMPQLVKRPRPWLYLGADGFEGLRRNAQTNLGKLLAQMAVNDAELILKQPEISYQDNQGKAFTAQNPPSGTRQLLFVARDLEYRILALASAYRLTGDERYARRAIAEMLHASSFPTWNPDHFLDVAHFALALALGYDWLYDQLTEPQRATIRQALYEKALLPSFAEPRRGKWSWVSAPNNWNQVCHAATVAAALALSDTHPAEAHRAIVRAVLDVQRSIRESFGPDGTGAEGPMYWGYGAALTSMLCQLLQQAVGNSFELENLPGFQRGAEYSMQMLHPLGGRFAYGDTYPGHQQGCAPFWIGVRFNRPDYIHRIERQTLEDRLKAPHRLGNNGGTLYALTWLNRDIPESANPPRRFVSDNAAPIPVAVFRSGFDRDSAYLGIKAGSADGPHGHMDVGSFLYVKDGVIWADELRGERYGVYDGTGKSFWDATQNGARHAVFRTGPRPHNILMIDDANQRVKTKATIAADAATATATVNLDGIYAGQATTVRRTFRFQPEPAVGLRIEDVLTGLKPGAVVRFQLCTSAAAEIAGRQLRLSQSGKHQILEMHTSNPGRWQVTPCDAIPKKIANDSPNPGYRMVEYWTQAPPDGKLALQLTFRDRLVAKSPSTVPAKE